MKATITREDQTWTDLILQHDDGPHQDGRFRWYEVETWQDTEVSGETIAEAHRVARQAWCDELTTDYLVCDCCGHCGPPEDDDRGGGCHCEECGATL